MTPIRGAVMPANLSPEYKAAEAAFRKARDPREGLDWVREVLRTMPEQKGADAVRGGQTRLAARDAAHDPEAQGDRSPPGGHQAADQGALRGARRAEEGRR